MTHIVIARVHPVHAMNAEQRQMAADPWTKLNDLSHWPACIAARKLLAFRFSSRPPEVTAACPSGNVKAPTCRLVSTVAQRPEIHDVTEKRCKHF